MNNFPRTSLGTDRLLAMIQSGADVNSYIENGRTALTKAAEAGTADIVQLLLEHGADANQSDRGRHTEGCTALMWAAASGNYRSVKMLLANGADVNAENWAGVTALMWAAYRGHTLIARLLLRRGARINAKARSGSTPLIEAVRGGKDMMVLLLLRQGAANIGGERLSALSMAQSYGYKAIARQLRDTGVRAHGDTAQQASRI